MKKLWWLPVIAAVFVLSQLYFVRELVAALLLFGIVAIPLCILVVGLIAVARKLS